MLKSLKKLPLTQVDERIINQHGSAKDVGPSAPDLPTLSELVARNEEKELKARKRFYLNHKQLIKKNQRRLQKLQFCRFFGQKLMPVIILFFTISYWYIGLSNINRD